MITVVTLLSLEIWSKFSLLSEINNQFKDACLCCFKLRNFLNKLLFLHNWTTD